MEWLACDNDATGWQHMTNLTEKYTGQWKRLLWACLIFAPNPLIWGGPIAYATPQSGQSSAPLALSYADIVDLADAAPVIVQVRIRNSIPLSAERAGNVPPGHRRVYIEADVTALIRGEGGISPAVTYLYDAPADARGKIAKLKKAQMLLFAKQGSRPGEIQLVARDAQIPATPAEMERVKGIVSTLVSPGAPPRIKGPGDAFHVSGTIAGEGETQIFLRTENGEPVSLSIIRRPGQEPRWAVALGEIVDEAARPPQPGSLLWYRLACALPPVLPAQSVRTLPLPDAEAARADYQLVMQALGPCERTRQLR
ncbi:hypothetical protein SCLO_1017120 [Sphingobium cloacae]|uniref:Uncharacterized protein n=1 Tax=Sphingobium cloacae TaxID=120107 RepID=A0A1E1F2S2_9SPHN|nr:hypothetical protein SCLO_1017120 [Sphingobium cloacae]